MEKKIVVNVSPDGTVTVEPYGFTGNACAKETEDLEKLLGKKLEKKMKSGLVSAVAETIGLGKK